MADEPPAKKRRLSNESHYTTQSSHLLSSLGGTATATPASDPKASAVSQAESTAEQTTETSLNRSDEGAVRKTARPVVLDEDGNPISRNQQKKLKRKQEWEAKKDDRKVLRKEKVLAKRERKKAAREADPDAAESKPREKVIHKQLPITFIIDCDFDDLMHDGERTSLSSQITRCYSDNKQTPFRAHLAISSFGGHLKERYDTVLAGVHKAYRGVRWLETDFVDVANQAKTWMADEDGGELAGAFAKYQDANMDELKAQGETVYLSAESDETLEELKPYSTYIIGGLVDKNREKGICHRRATQRGVKTARLPIGDFLEMSSRKVLTTNHVNEIMLRWLETSDWGKAFITVIPKRKGGQLKGQAREDFEDDANGYNEDAAEPRESQEAEHVV